MFGERLRWRIANLLNRLSGQCWADLVWWATSTARQNRRKGDSALPWRPVTELCRKGVEETGACYCNKLRRDGA